jgi:hypothetical protein
MDFTRLQELGTGSFIIVCCSWVLRDALQTQLFIVYCRDAKGGDKLVVIVYVMTWS